MLSGCVAVKRQIREPNVAGRYDSAKSAAALAQCAAAALPNFKLKQQGEAWNLIRQDGIKMLTRWDFFPTNGGSQAELRNGAKDDGGAAKVRSCL
jgi:hypothetical protein